MHVHRRDLRGLRENARRHCRWPAGTGHRDTETQRKAMYLCVSASPRPVTANAARFMPPPLLRGCRDPRLERISRRAVHVERAERRDLVHVRIEHAEGGRILAAARRVPDRTVARDLDLRRVGRPLRLRIQRERLVARIELVDRRRRCRRRPPPRCCRPDPARRRTGSRCAAAPRTP